MLMQATPEDSPLMIEWEKYKFSEEYNNSAHWIAIEEHRHGSMWAVFMAGFLAANPEGTKSTPAVRPSYEELWQALQADTEKTKQLEQELAVAKTRLAEFEAIKTVEPHQIDTYPTPRVDETLQIFDTARATALTTLGRRLERELRFMVDRCIEQGVAARQYVYKQRDEIRRLKKLAIDIAAAAWWCENNKASFQHGDPVTDTDISFSIVLLGRKNAPACYHAPSADLVLEKAKERVARDNEFETENDRSADTARNQL